jgi:hypothetical protein
MCTGGRADTVVCVETSQRGNATVYVALAVDDDVDEDYRARSALRLRTRLAAVDDVEAVDPAPVEELPAGAKSGLAAWDLLAVSLGAGGALTVLVEALRDWLGRQNGPHRVSVTIDGDVLELDNATPEDQQRLVDAFVERHGTPPS